LEPSEKQWFEEHLFTCPECALDLDAFRTIQGVIRSIQIDEYPFDSRDPAQDTTYN
jgi:hypothetical protein